MIAGEQEILRTADSRALVGRLIEVLGPTLVSTLAGSTDTHAAMTWATPDGPKPNMEALTRLRCAADAWRAISEVEGDDIARAWFIGGNSWLSEDAPVTAIREGRFTEVTTAVTACVEDTFSG
ncbi:hypothetical protein CQ042_00050 [Microbacterium sp. MYb62]|nr:hypothetical protein CQ042_00050 [Microbacterium sp. MYb62]